MPGDYGYVGVVYRRHPLEAKVPGDYGYSAGEVAVGVVYRRPPLILWHLCLAFAPIIVQMRPGD